jgi:hypothetical protein
LSAKDVDKKGGNVIGYFCTPDGHVLNFFVGSVQGPDLYFHAKFANDLWQKIKNVSTRDESQRIARAWHDTYSNDAFEQRSGLKWSARTSLSSENNGSTILLSAEAATAEIERFRRTSSQNYSLYHAWNSVKQEDSDPLLKYSELYHPERRYWKNTGQNLLMKMPLPDLSTIEKPMFDFLANEKYDPPSSRSLELVRQFQTAKNRNQYIMLVSVNDQKDKVGTREFDDDSKIGKLAEKYFIAKVDDKELFHVLTSSGNRPLLKSGTKRRYHFFNSSGKLVKSLPDRSMNELYYDMNKTAK